MGSFLRPFMSIVCILKRHSSKNDNGPKTGPNEIQFSLKSLLIVIILNFIKIIKRKKIFTRILLFIIKLRQ